jgi:chorismate dehydratase
VVKVSLVSYLNSIPFKWGLQNYENKPVMDLMFDYPANVAKKLIEFKAHVGLVPVATIPKIPQAQIISPYGIAADGCVDSVILVSNSPLNKIKTIWLDYQSKTSINLVKILAVNFWKLNNINFLPASESYLQSIKPYQGAVVIGDRAFIEAKKFNYVIDLSAEWKKYTGLPFVFAAWVSNKQLSDNWLKAFNDSLKFGIENLTSILSVVSKESSLSTESLSNYLINKIKYNISASSYQDSMGLFIKMLNENQVINNC